MRTQSLEGATLPEPLATLPHTTLSTATVLRCANDARYGLPRPNEWWPVTFRLRRRSTSVLPPAPTTRYLHADAAIDRLIKAQAKG